MHSSAQWTHIYVNNNLWNSMNLEEALKGWQMRPFSKETENLHQDTSSQQMYTDWIYISSSSWSEV